MPRDYARPVASAKARRLSKCDADKLEMFNDPYMHSQVYFEKNNNLAKMNKDMLRSQTLLNGRLAEPKRARCKFSATQTKQTNQVKSVTFIEKL